MADLAPRERPLGSALSNLLHSHAPPMTPGHGCIGLIFWRGSGDTTAPPGLPELAGLCAQGTHAQLLFLPKQWMQLEPSRRGRQRGACQGGELRMRSAGWMGQAMAVKASGLQQSRSRGLWAATPSPNPPSTRPPWPLSRLLLLPPCSPHSAQARWFTSSLHHVALLPCPPGSLPPRPHGSAESREQLSHPVPMA